MIISRPAATLQLKARALDSRERAMLRGLLGSNRTEIGIDHLVVEPQSPEQFSELRFERFQDRRAGEWDHSVYS